MLVIIYFVRFTQYSIIYIQYFLKFVNFPFFRCFANKIVSFRCVCLFVCIILIVQEIRKTLVNNLKNISSIQWIQGAVVLFVMSKNRLDKVSIRLVSILSKMMYNNCVVEIIVNNHSRQHLYFFLKNLVQKLLLFASQLVHLIWSSFKNIFASPWIPFIFLLSFCWKLVSCP